MTKMHENEFHIDKQLVLSLLKSQCPQWAELPIQAIASSGTDNAIFRLGSKFVARFPRTDGSLTNINKEYEWVPKLAQHLKISISEPIFKGNPEHGYPWLWTIAKWNEGQNPDFEKENEHATLAIDLADFINELHDIKLTNGPYSRRGIPLNTKILDEETRQAINKLEGDIDILSITSLWDKLTNIPYWNKDPVWIHGDLLPGNILVKDNRLSAVIDFSDVGVGDPACDLIVAWNLLNANSRKTFRDNLKNIDDDTWERGRGWALSIALIILPYYMHTNPVLVSVARRMIDQVLSDTLT